MAFTRFPESVMIELDGVDAAINHQFLKMLLDQMQQEGIPYTVHWGKVNRLLNKDRVQYMYGPERIKAWKKQRSRVMTQEVQQLFNNEFMQQCGLDTYVSFP